MGEKHGGGGAQAVKGHDTRTERSIEEVNWFAWGRRNRAIIGRDKRPGPRRARNATYRRFFSEGGTIEKDLAELTKNHSVSRGFIAPRPFVSAT